jgi:hypothetical protein
MRVERRARLERLLMSMKLDATIAPGLASLLTSDAVGRLVPLVPLLLGDPLAVSPVGQDVTVAVVYVPFTVAEGAHVWGTPVAFDAPQLRGTTPLRRLTVVKNET